MSEKPEKDEIGGVDDLRDYGMDYDVRLSVRITTNQMEDLDKMALATGTKRAKFVRNLIDGAAKVARSRGRIE